MRNHSRCDVVACEIWTWAVDCWHSLKNLVLSFVQRQQVPEECNLLHCGRLQPQFFFFIFLIARKCAYLALCLQPPERNCLVFTSCWIRYWRNKEKTEEERNKSVTWDRMRQSLMCRRCVTALCDVTGGTKAVVANVFAFCMFLKVWRLVWITYSGKKQN